MDGRWLFLHPLLMRVLLTHHCSYSGLPASIHGTLVEVEPQMQTPALRKRHKFLGHLPLGGELQYQLHDSVQIRFESGMSL